eukprot:CAMPEP_0197476798 /NCGR_PEP_ID=MMETSP1309-20131121/10389_1 /TAXON_ID=464262 /ORGANISM="Genus nov. species nov., Strain RCC998" /LENGTH=259 /DNA_ID=CAMNT_0043017347 /DNA_START=140 /DNA_END=919 /DNA_ORIENTATION=-
MKKDNVGGNQGCGPVEWIKKKVESFKTKSPELFSFATGCAAGAVVLVATALVRRAALQSEECATTPSISRTKKKTPKIKVAVQEGETLGDIMVRYVGDYTDDNVKLLKRLNRSTLKDVDLLQPGQELIVPDNRELPEEPTPQPPVIAEKVKAPREKTEPKKRPSKPQKVVKEKKKEVKKEEKKEKKKVVEKKKKGKKEDKEEPKKEEKKGGWFGFGGGKKEVSESDAKDTKSSKKNARRNSKKSEGKDGKKIKLPQDKW